AGGQILVSASTRERLVTGDLGEAIARDLGSLRLRDLHYPERLFELSLPDLPGLRSEIREAIGPRYNLPAQPTAFVGRASQIAEVVALLRQGGVRLVTLTGPGGTGKTRLSLEVARALSADFPDGVTQVALASVLDPALVPTTIAQALEVTEVPGRPVVEVL